MIRKGTFPLLAALTIGAAGSADAQQRFEISPGTITLGRNIASSADPSAIVAAEVAFGQLARRQGQWTAFRKTADIDAVMFVPGAINAQRWLNKQANPAKSVTWAPDRIFISCDGSYAVSHGHAENPDGTKGGFVTIWRRQQDNSYKWVLDWSAKPPTTSGEDGEVDGKVTDCPARRAPDAPARVAGETPAAADLRAWRENGGRGKRPKPPKYEVVRIPDPPPANGEGQSGDGSLHWQWTTAKDGARSLKVTARYAGKTETVIDDAFPATR